MGVPLLNRLGLHVSAGGRNGFKEALQAAADAGSSYAVVVACDQDIAPDVLAVSPKTITVFRTQPAGQEDRPDNIWTDPIGAAHSYMALCVPKWALNNRYKYFSLLNEPNPATLAEWKALGIFLSTGMDIAVQNGYKLCLGNISTGTPADADAIETSSLEAKIAAMGLDFWRKVIAGGHLWGVHEYGFGGMLKESAPFHALRYKRTQAYLAKFGITGLKFIVTENGGFNGGYFPGWLEDLKWYNEQIGQDPDVIGAAIYQVGGAENISPHFAELTTYVTTPVDQPPVIVPPVSAYLSKIYLAPQVLSKAEAAEFDAVRDGVKGTATQSADDAVTINTSPQVSPDSSIVVFKPSGWTDSIDAYLRAKGVKNIEYREFQARGLPVPYRSQFGPGADYAPGDCGSADVAMILNYRGQAVTVDDVSKASGAPPNFLVLGEQQLIKAAQAFGLPLTFGVNQTWATLQADLDNLQPTIALVNYAALPDRLKREPAYTRGHWILVVGWDGQNVIWHDPDEMAAAQGANKVMSLAEFDRAWSTLNSDFRVPRQTLRVAAAVIPPIGTALPVQLGLHDIGGLEYMRSHGLKGCGLLLVSVQDQPAPWVNVQAYADAGIKVIARIGYGYADGSGTLPPPDRLAAFEAAVIKTIETSKGVAYWQYGNEINNIGEWPSSFSITPQYYIDSYNRVWDAVNAMANLGPCAIDPYFGPNSNNRDWWTQILTGIKGAAALFLHPKTQSNDPAEIYSTAKFSNDPLTWQYLNFRTIETSLEVVSTRFKALPVYLSEVNPQRIAYPATFGWLADNSAWVSEARRYVSEWNAVATHQPITGIVFYRWADDVWRLADKPILLTEMLK